MWYAIIKNKKELKKNMKKTRKALALALAVVGTTNLSGLENVTYI